MKYVNLDCANPDCWVGLVPVMTERGMRWWFCPVCEGNGVVLTEVSD